MKLKLKRISLIAFALFLCGCNNSDDQQTSTPSPYDHIEFDADHKPSEVWNRNHVIFTAYFTKDVDTQRNITWKANDFVNIKPWHLSVDWLNIRGVIFHDGLDEDFKKKYSTSNIEFVEAKPHPNLSIHMYRFLLALDYLEKHPEIEAAFVTDGSDVVVRKNPFTMIKPDMLYVGSEPNTVGTTWDWLKNQMSALFNNDDARVQAWRASTKDKTLLNSGISGGYRDIFISYLQSMKQVASASTVNKDKIIDMAAINVVVYGANFEKKFITGFPLHSEFRKMEINNKDVYFVHK